MIEEKKRVLGRGLESLIPAPRKAAPDVAADTASGELVREIRLEEIERSPYQPRRQQDEAALQELAQSIRAQGVLQPIVIRTVPGGGNGVAEIENLQQIRYQLIAGERRWLASRMAGKTTVPAILRQVSNEQAMEMALIENLQREDLDCLEMAHAFDRLAREFGLTQEQMSQRTGKDRGTIGNYLRLLKLPPEVRAALARHDLSFGHAKELMSLEDPHILLTAAEKVMKEGLSVRATQELVNHLIYLGPMVGKKQDKPARVVDANVKAAEQELERSLGCRVKINDHNGKGKIVIQYASLEDFDRVVEALGK